MFKVLLVSVNMGAIKMLDQHNTSRKPMFYQTNFNVIRSDFNLQTTMCMVAKVPIDFTPNIHILGSIVGLMSKVAPAS